MKWKHYLGIIILSVVDRHILPATNCDIGLNYMGSTLRTTKIFLSHRKSLKPPRKYKTIGRRNQFPISCCNNYARNVQVTDKIHFNITQNKGKRSVVSVSISCAKKNEEKTVFSQHFPTSPSHSPLSCINTMAHIFAYTRIFVHQKHFVIADILYKQLQRHSTHKQA